MPGPSRSTQRGGPSDRRDGAQRQRRTRRQPPARHARRVSWSRRLGIAAGLLLLVGGSIAFASQTLPKASPETVARAPVPPPLTILPPVTAVTRQDKIELTAVAPQNLRHDQAYEARIFVSGEPVGRMDLPDDDQFALSPVPLAEGANTIQTTLVGEGGESARSTPLVMTRDDVPPTIKIVEPTTAVYTDDVTLVGKTEPGADIEITDDAGRSIDSSIGQDGRFSADVALGMGRNGLILHSSDAAGNTTTIHAAIERASSSASIELSVTPNTVYVPDLPKNVGLSVMIRDELGRPVDDQQVIFGVSPPDRATTTYTATTMNGRATFSGLTIGPGEGPGAWLVTAFATLPSGIELRDNASFSLQANA